MQLLAAFALLVTMGVTAQQLWRTRKAIIDGAEQQMSRLVMVFAEQTSRAVETVDVIIRAAVDMAAERPLRTPADIDAMLTRRVAGLRQVSAIVLADPAGAIANASGPEAWQPLSAAGMAALAAHRADAGLALRISGPVRDWDGRWIALISRRIATEGGGFGGIAIGSLILAYFEDFYKAVELKENGSVLLYRRDGTVLARYPHQESLIGTSYADQPPFAQVLSKGIAGTVLMTSPFDASIRVLAIRALRAFPLAVSVSVDEGELLAVWWSEVRVFGTAGVLGGLGLAGMLLLLAQRTRQAELAERLRLAEALARLGSLDPLTGLLNRTALTQRMEALFAAAQADKSLVALLFLDLDGFKQINDVQGHKTGDAVLRVVAGRLAQAAGSAPVGRWGGDEFVIVLAAPAPSSVPPAGTALAGQGPAAVMALADAVLRAVAAPIDTGLQTVRVGASIGLAVYPGDGTSPDALVGAADIAMYVGKQAGGGIVQVYDPALAQTVATAQDLERELRLAIQDDALSMNYQPIMDAAGTRCVALEALLRWSHPTRGAVSPATFVPVAEHAGLIGRLGAWALTRACADAVTWPGQPAPAVSVNVSLAQFASGTLVQDVTAALALSGLPVGRLHLELTESMVGADHVHIVPVLHTLRDMGICIALDDFGTGFSSLSRLRAWPVDIIKIDRSFVSSMAQEGTAVIRATLLVAADHNLSVTAEGVETSAQWMALRQLGVRWMQGYLFSHPLDAAAVGPWLTRAA